MAEATPIGPPATTGGSRHTGDAILHHVRTFAPPPEFVRHALGCGGETWQGRYDRLPKQRILDILVGVPSLAEVFRQSATKLLGYSAAASSLPAPALIDQLGHRDAVRLLLVSALREHFRVRCAQNGQQDIFTHIWQHSIASALAAEVLTAPTHIHHHARALADDSIIDDAFFAALLHDVGKILLLICLPKSYGRLWREAGSTPAGLLAWETDHLDIDHTIAARAWLQHIGAHDAISHAAWLHHQPPPVRQAISPHDHVIELVVRANHLAGLDAAGRTNQQAAELLRTAQTKLPAFVGSFEADHRSASVEANHYETERLARQTREQERDTFNLLHSIGEQGDIESAFRQCANELGKAFNDQPLLLGFRPPDSSTFFYAKSPNGQPGSDAPLCSTHLSDEALQALRCSLDERIGDGDCDAETRELADRVTEQLWQAAHPDRPATNLKADEIDRRRYCTLMIFQGEPPKTARHAKRYGLIDPVLRILVQALCEQFALTQQRDAVLSAVGRQFAGDQSAQSAATNSQPAQTPAGDEVFDMLAEMAAGAAHELNNPLAVISGRAELLYRDTDDAAIQQPLRVIREHAFRAAQMVQELMDIAKPEPARPALQSLGDVLERTSQYWQATSSLTADRLDLIPPADELTVFADADQLSDILRALMANAVEATDARTARLKLHSPSSPADEKVRITIEDNGPGMSPETLQKAFIPFFSHRTAGRGRGLGLSRAYRLAKQNGGDLWLTSMPGQGTQAHLLLPARS